MDTAFVSGAFIDDPGDCAAVIENKLGDGVATLVASVNYPGYAALFPLYNAIVREMITASARTADIQVLGSDRLRWAVYERDKLYLLNTDYDMPITVKIIKGNIEKDVTLDSLELKSINI